MIGTTTIMLSGVFFGLSTYLFLDLKECRQKGNELELKGEVIELNEWETLLHQLGIIKCDNGDRVEIIGQEERTYYTITTLKTSPGIKLSDFTKQIDTLRIKLNAPRLEIEGLGDEIYIKEIKTNVEPISYKLEQVDNKRIPIGINDEGEIVYWYTNIDSSIIIGGVPGCGKSTLINSIALYLKINGAELHMIDLKAGIEFSDYEGCEGIVAYAEEEAGAKKVISQYHNLIEDRLSCMKERGYKDFEKFNIDYPGELTRQFLIIDEFADLMTHDNIARNEDRFGKFKDYEIDVIDLLKKIARKGRAAGCHMILSSQRMTADSFPPTMKACVTAIVGFKTANAANSELIIDHKGLERLDKREAIAVLGSKEQHIRTMYLAEEVMKQILKE